jgi:hypothetical protein
VVGDYFYYIANSGWDSLDDHGVVKEGKSMTAPIIMRARLSRSATVTQLNGCPGFSRNACR